ncbi:hypothetical protein [uncultured Chitinophaga sp.]|jgi:hypothetical protein|uniref:hypothetical protein n=1 Tax=uncultured Chitinophaga sp. TaxID=339340 RepID=UPI0026133E76|nr:hypothetical protein [uncultured Chitinophaga sp.]
MKKFTIGLSAVVLAVAAVTYTKASKNMQGAFVPQWFLYSDGGDDIASNITEARNVNNYIVVGGSYPVECTSNVHLCAIQTEMNSSGQPVIIQGTPLDNQLVTYFNTSGASVGYLLREKP